VLAVTNPLTPVADRLGKLVRMLSSDKDYEVLATVQALRRTLTGAGADIHALAAMIEKPTNGGVSEKDLKRVYDAGVADGLRRAEDAQHGSDAFRNIDASPWHRMALYCQQRIDRLDERHHQFIADMASRTVWSDPTEKQGKYLKSLFFKLGGKP
jgi:hypothetical protein